ncbi:MAG TPA: glycosyltransferase family 4 protein [Pyrinomonadaceae bacterium]|nr:glycosyltransferase family 4 protein [Pyrinomonadaceae bacterium]
MVEASKMRVLYFAPKECWPPDTGAKLRNYHLARALSREAHVTYLAFADNAAGEASSSEGDPAGWCEQVVTVPLERGYTLSKLARGALGRTPVTVLNYTTRAMAAELERILGAHEFDVVQVESVHLAAYLPLIRAARGRPAVVCDWHNIESDLMRQYAGRTANALRRAYARRTASQLAALERRTAREADTNVTCSEPDRERLLAFAPGARAHVVENGVDTDYYSDEQVGRAYEVWRSRRADSGGDVSSGGDARRRRILFVGSMDYHANVDGAVEFARETWPRVSESLPDLVLTIVGRNPAPEVRALAELRGVEVTGTVEDVRPYYREALASVVPLNVGGGSRLKIYETLAAGVPVISTRLGAEGVETGGGESIVYAETPEEFCRAINDIARDERRWAELAANGRRAVAERYDWATLGARLSEIHRGLLKERKSALS